VALGCDLFDSASYAIYAKDDRYMTVDGTQRLEFLNYLPCACPVCRGHTIQDLREATKSERELMLAEHNLHACMAEIETIKQAISEGSLWDLVERRARSHPSLTSALNQMSKYAEWLEEGSPSFKGHGVFYYDYHSISKPEVTRHRNQLIGNYMKPNNSEVLLLVTPPSKKPFTSSDEHSALRRKLEHEFGSELEKFHICFYAAPYGVIPEDLCETYPLSQFECSQPLDLETIRITANSVASYAKQSGHNVVYLYRANGQLEDEVESQLMYELNESKVNFISIWSCDPWSIDSLNTLTKTLGERR
jgi:7-cyano-7-deazaguanine tRNA-ribosyltransferase